MVRKKKDNKKEENNKKEDEYEKEEHNTVTFCLEQAIKEGWITAPYLRITPLKEKVDMAQHDKIKAAINKYVIKNSGNIWGACLVGKELQEKSFCSCHKISEFPDDTKGDFIFFCFSGKEGRKHKMVQLGIPMQLLEALMLLELKEVKEYERK